jgi:hypothetical protein
VLGLAGAALGVVLWNLRPRRRPTRTDDLPPQVWKRPTSGIPARATGQPVADWPALPLALKLGWTGFTAVLVPTYWRQYGPKNFLWSSDLALFETNLALWTERSLPASVAAVSVLPLEIAWNLDFLLGGRPLGLAGYMFDRSKPRFLRALSLFHVALPLTWWYLLRRLGYDRRALPVQTAIAWAVLPLSFVLTTPEENVNWVHGLKSEGVRLLPPLLYLALLMALFPICVYVPTHHALARLFPPSADERFSSR